MIDDAHLLEELFEEAPCGYLATDAEGHIQRVNRTFERWTGHSREELLAGRRLPDLLTTGGRIYFETHVAPMLHLEDAVREIAVEVRRADGTKLPALLNAALRRDEAGEPAGMRVTVFDATERRGYEQELLRARRREEETAQRLQRSLLAGELPEGPDFDAGVAYRPSGRGLEVGGDWFDLFWIEPGRSLALVVGDVVGKGIEAAATMGQLRSAVRALTTARSGPGEVIEALDLYCQRHEVGRMTTLAVGVLDLQAGTLRYACAAHPPPVVVVPGKGPGLLWGGRSLPLDAWATGVHPRKEAVEPLGPGATVVLYTDGLIERRGIPLDQGLERLLEATAAREGESAESLTSGLVHDMHDPHSADDVCLLAVRLA